MQVAAVVCSTPWVEWDWFQVAEAAVMWHVVPVIDEQVMMAPLIVEVMLAVEVWLAVEDTWPEILFEKNDRNVHEIFGK